MAQLRVPNPFSITKAVDLSDDQIQTLWVSVSDGGDEFSEYTRPSSPMPTFVLGAKGSGKTHLMRYHSFELQKLRHTKEKMSLREGIADGYIGIYVRCSGLNSGRFKGKRQTDEIWADLFAYYIELWLTQHLLEVIQALGLGFRDGDEMQLCRELAGLFDKPLEPEPATIGNLVDHIAQLQHHLDFQINNCVMTGKIEVNILATRGRLVFGIPKLLSQRYEFLRKVLFVYSIDEFENLTVQQQKLINTLVREKELPSTLRIGARLYGIKTYSTDSAEEENLRHSEFEILSLDELFRMHKQRYALFARSLIEKRLIAALGLETEKNLIRSPEIDWENYFEQFDDAWDSKDSLSLVKGKPSPERRHFQNLIEKVGNSSIASEQMESLVKQLCFPEFPLLEKVNLLLLYQDMFKGKDILLAATEIHARCARFLENRNAKGSYWSSLNHYKNDLIAQLHRENDSKQYYLGLETFITMSAGLPRALLTILRSVFEWSLFNGEDPLRKNQISREAQYRGVKDASDWFYDNMRKAGDDGIAIQTAIDRLARLFRVNRFADKPVECSLISFNGSEQGVSHEALRVLRLAESRSFLNKVVGGQKDKNSERVMMKFQISTMLAPRWDLPLARRGSVTLTSEQFDAVFDISKDQQFESVISEWRERMTAPRFGKLRTRTDAGQQALWE